MRAARVLSSLALCAGLVLASGAAATCLAQPATIETDPDGARILTNADVVRMLRSGFSDGDVIAAIQKTGTRFDLSSASLAELRYAGVSDSVIVAMLAAANAAPGAPETRPPAPTAPPPVPVAPSPARVVTPRPATPPERPARDRDEEKHATRGGGVFGLSLGGNYVFVIDEKLVDESFGNDEPRFGASLGLQAGGHVGRHTAILADVHAAFWPQTSESESAGLFSLGPALRFSPVTRLSLECGVSLALALPDWGADPWLGPAGHLEAGVELTGGRSSFALELLARFDLAYVSRTDCDSCETATLGRATTQLALTWY